MTQMSNSFAHWAVFSGLLESTLYPPRAFASAALILIFYSMILFGSEIHYCEAELCNFNKNQYK